MGATSLGGIPKVVAAPMIGAAAGAGTAALLGTLAWGLVASGSSPATVAFFAVAGTVAGIAASAGTALLGAHTRSALEWPIIGGAGTALALVIVAGTTRVAYLGLFCGVAAATSWLMAIASRRFLASRPLTGSVNASVLVGYVLVLAFTVILGIVLFSALIYLLHAWSVQRSQMT
jgi:hypothetical protein